MIETEIQRRHLRVKLSDVELKEQSLKLAEANIRLRQAEEDKKRVTSDFTARIESAKVTISELSGIITSGYDFRDVEVSTQFNTPRNGKKRIVRNDTFEEVAVEDMGPADQQRVLALEEQAEKPTASRI